MHWKVHKEKESNIDSAVLVCMNSFIRWMHSDNPNKCRVMWNPMELLLLKLPDWKSHGRLLSASTLKVDTSFKTRLRRRLVEGKKIIMNVPGNLICICLLRLCLLTRCLGDMLVA